MSAFTPDNKDRFLAIAWYDFLSWAIGQDDILAQFETESGLRRSRAPRNVIEAMIDKATGYDKEGEKYYIEFTRWATENLWGIDEAPQAYLKFLKSIDGE